jgi:hypothetical protein
MWIEHRSLFLEELLRMEGRGGLQEVPCSDCGGSSPEFKCEDCFGIDLRCSSCITAAHQRHPLHRLQVSVVFLYYTRQYLTNLHRNGMVIISNVRP